MVSVFPISRRFATISRWFVLVCVSRRPLQRFKHTCGVLGCQVCMCVICSSSAALHVVIHFQQLCTNPNHCFVACRAVACFVVVTVCAGFSLHAAVPVVSFC
jgi:hypothetical protein